MQNIQTGATPKGFYENGESLKYICKIGCKYLNISATYDHESTFADTMKKGTVGFYNEYLNGLPANYTLKSISFTDVISGLPVTELQYGRETDVDIRITSVDSVFSLDTRVVLNQLYCPLTTSDYINTGAETLQDNFRFDRVKLITTTAVVNGEQFGTDNQCITQAQSVRISASELQITYRCSLATSYTTFIAGKPAKNRNYLIFATPQDIAVSKTIDTDRNAVICHTANYTTDNTDATLFQIVGSDIYFHQYPDELMNDYTDFKAFSADFCLVRGIFQTKSKLDVLLKSLTFKIEAVKVYNDNIVLEQYDFNLTAYPLDLNLIQQIDIEQPTNFKVKAGSIYDNIILQRVTALDSGNYVAYYFEYPFRVRYETWVQLISAAYPNTGTQDWAFYEDNGWAIQFNIYASMFDNVAQWQTDFIHTSNLSFNAFDELSTDKSTCQITTWNVNQTENFDGNIRGDEDTMILATFTGDFSSLPAGATGYIGQIVLDSPEIGGVYYAQTAASDTTPITGGIWKASATLTKVNNNIITVTAIIDHTKLNDLSAGIYPLNYLCFSARLDYLYDVDLILQENLDPILQENIQGLQQE